MQQKTIILHIGLPKTGSTSLQRYLHDHSRHLQHQGFDLWISDILKRETHTELHLSALRDGVETFSTLKHSEWDRKELYEATRASIRLFVQKTQSDRLIFTSEGLSFLRTAAEVERVRSLFPDGVAFQVILMLRDKQDWLRSYTQQIYKKPGRARSQDPRSALYVEPDTWLIDFDQIIDCYSAVFGSVITLGYHKDLAVENMLVAMGLDPNGFESHYRLNVTGDAVNSNGFIGKFKRKFSRLLR